MAAGWLIFGKILIFMCGTWIVKGQSKDSQRTVRGQTEIRPSAGQSRTAGESRTEQNIDEHYRV